MAQQPFQFSRRAAIRTGLGLALACSFPGQSEPAPANEEEVAATALWERMIEAKGGRERLHRVETLVETVHAHVVFPNPKFKNGDPVLVSAIALPDRIWTWADTGSKLFIPSIQVTNLSTGFHYLVYPGNDARKSPDLRGAVNDLEVTQIVVFNETRWVRPRPVRIRTDKDIPHGVTVLETQWNGNRWDFWISKKDYLPARILKYEPVSWAPNGVIISYFDLADYRPVDAIQIPHKSCLRTREIDSLTFTPFTFSVNPRLRENLFSTIPRSEDPADAWKPRDKWGR